MNSEAFFNHHGLHANPFRAEEARQDRVFEQIEEACRHPEFEKILGDLDRPASSVVFGERGAGKTALRIQIEDAVAQSNLDRTDGQCLVIAYDDFNNVLSRLCEHKGMLDPSDAVSSITLSDHLDAVLNLAVAPLVDAALNSKERTEGPYSGIKDVRKNIRAASASTRADMQMLQVCYDQAENGPRRGDRLRRSLQLGSRPHPGAYKWLAILSVVIAAGWSVAVGVGAVKEGWISWIPSILLLLGAGSSAIWWLRLRMSTQGVARRLAKSIRVCDRDVQGFRDVLSVISRDRLVGGDWPQEGSDEARFRMLDRLARVLAAIGVRGIFVLVDRVDEPVAINGDPERMRAFMWPLFRNKVLQLGGVGFKFLLPLEVRDSLYRESPEFFREARLDKQNLVERLSWSGPMLYDLCTARYRACCESESNAGLMDLFDEGVVRQDVVDALDQMHQPRDAFKLMYGLIQEHCSNVTHEQSEFKISRTVLDVVKKRQVERRDALMRGSRPA